MILQGDTAIGSRYTSAAQKSRVISEAWFGSNLYCLSCDQDKLTASAVNNRATDFVCPSCFQAYELKACQKRPKTRLVDGDYRALLGRISEGSTPALMVLERDENWLITGLTAIHHLFITADVVEARRPLSVFARRAGWTGCNIRLDLIAPDAQVEVITRGKENNPRFVRTAFQRFNSLNQVEPKSRGWTTLTLKLIRDLKEPCFSLDRLYQREDFLAAHYPGNRNIRAKIRQQLQVLRDLGFVSFEGKGRYRLLL
jgi:type II restriction enzyme